MAIEVKHGVGAGSVAAAAFGGGEGRARTRAALGAAAASTRAEQARLGREQQLKLAGTAHKRGLERMEFNAGLQQQAADAAQGRRREDFEFRHTAQQKAEIEKLADAEAAIMSSSDYTDEEKAEARRRIAAKRAGIKPVARGGKPTPADIFKSGTYRDPESGYVYPIKPDKTLGPPLHKPPERKATRKDRIDAFKEATAFARNPETGVVDNAMLALALERMGFPAKVDGEAPAPMPVMPGVVVDADGTAPAATPGATAPEGGGEGDEGWDPLAGHKAVGKYIAEFFGLGGDSEEKPLEPAEEIQRINGGEADPSATDPEDVKDLRTADMQIRVGGENLASLRRDLAQAEAALRSAPVDYAGGLLGNEGNLAKQRIGQVKREVEAEEARIKGMKDRRDYLVRRSEMLKGIQVVRAAKQKAARQTAAGGAGRVGASAGPVSPTPAAKPARKSKGRRPGSPRGGRFSLIPPSSTLFPPGEKPEDIELREVLAERDKARAAEAAAAKKRVKKRGRKARPGDVEISKPTSEARRRALMDQLASDKAALDRFRKTPTGKRTKKQLDEIVRLSRRAVAIDKALR